MKSRSTQTTAVLALCVAILSGATGTFSSLASIVPLPKPALVKVSAVSLFEIDLTWRDRSTNEDGFQIERSSDNRSFRQIAQVLPNTTVYHDKGLFPGTRYFYRIRAFNAAGASGYSSESTRTPSPPVPLTIVTWYPTSTGGAASASGTNAPDCVSLAEGFQHILELNKDGTVSAWGNNTNGQATVPTNLTGVVAISAGGVQSLALKKDGTVVGWGSAGAATPPDDLSGVVAISAGGTHSLALKGDGTVIGWGDNTFGQATPPTNLVGVVAIAAGSDHSLALKSDGTIVEWGDSSGGATTPPTNLTSVVAIAAGYHRSFAVNSDGTVVGWGDNSFGAATPPTNLTDVAAIASGQNYTVALRKDGTLADWGQQPPFGNVLPLSDLDVAAVSVSTAGYESAALSLSPASPSETKAVVLATNRIRLSWRDNSSHELGFRIERAVPNGTNPPSWTEIAVVGPNRTNYIDSTLATNVPYEYRIRAYNHFGTSPYGREVVVITTPLAAPFLANVTLGTNGVDVWWSDGYSGIDGFKIERALDNNGAPGIWTEIASTNAAGLGFYRFSDLNVQTNTTYWYRLRAFNILGYSPYSDPPLPVKSVPPSSPAYFSAGVSSNTATLTWYEYDFSIQGFKIERAPDVSGAPGTWTQIAITGPAAPFYADSGLSANTTNWYRMRAFNWVGDSPYTIPVSTVVLPTQTPFPFNASMGIQTNTVQLAWGYRSIEDGFDVERAPDVNGSPGTWSQIGLLNDTNVLADSFTDTNVLANSTNWYRVRAFSILGFSDYTDPVSVITLPPFPTPIGFGAALATNGVGLFWSYPSDEPAGFIIDRAPADALGNQGTWTEIGFFSESNYDGGTFTDTNVTANTTNWYRILIFNWAGFSVYDAPVRISLVPPVTPILSDVTPYRNTVRIDWNGDAQSFEIQRAPDASGSPGVWSTIATVSDNNGGYPYSYTDAGLVLNHTYWYRVRAITWLGASPYSAPASATIGPPATPYGLLAQKAPANTVELSWADNALDEDAFTIESAPDAGGVPGTWTQIALIGATNAYSVDYWDTNVVANSTNWYRVRAINNLTRSGYSAPASVSIIPPGLPTSFLATAISSNQVNLVWANDYDGFVEGYKIQRALDAAGSPGPWAEITNIAEVYQTSLSDSAVNPGTKYWYRASAYNWAGDSPFTDAISVTTPDVVPAPPQILSLIATNNDVHIFWSTVGGATDTVQAAVNLSGSYTDISPALPISGSGNTVTDFLDAGTLTNAGSRFYRIHRAP
jgi:titin